MRRIYIYVTAGASAVRAVSAVVKGLSRWVRRRLGRCRKGEGRFERTLQARVGEILTLTAAGRNGQLAGQAIERARAFLNGVQDVTFGDVIADTHVHG
jgi:hypothetical protein